MPMRGHTHAITNPSLAMNLMHDEPQPTDTSETATRPLARRRLVTTWR